MDRSGTGSRNRRASSISRRLRLTDHCVGAFDSISNASLMEVRETDNASFVEVLKWLFDMKFSQFLLVAHHFPFNLMFILHLKAQYA